MKTEIFERTLYLEAFSSPARKNVKTVLGRLENSPNSQPKLFEKWNCSQEKESFKQPEKATCFHVYKNL